MLLQKNGEHKLQVLQKFVIIHMNVIIMKTEKYDS